MNNNYGAKLLEFDEELDCYIFNVFGGYWTKEKAEEEINNSMYGGYIIRRVPAVYNNIHTEVFIKGN